MEYDSIKHTMIDFLDASVRTKNVLKHIGVETIGDLLRVDSTQLSSIPNIGVATTGEIRSLQQLYLIQEDKVDPLQNFNQWILLKTARTKIQKYFQENDLELSKSRLSVRAYRVLKHQELTKLSQLIFLTPPALNELSSLGKTSVDEILRFVNFQIRQHKHEILLSCQPQATGIRKKVPTLQAMMLQKRYQEKIVSFVTLHDSSIQSLDIPKKLKNYLEKHEFYRVSQVVIPDERFEQHFAKVHIKYRQILELACINYLKRYEAQLIAYCNGELNAQIQPYFLKKRLLQAYENYGFEGLSFNQIRELFPDELSDEVIKTLVASCLEEKSLEYVDYRCYRLYPSFTDFANQLEEKQVLNIKLLRNKWEGLTLEAIGQQEGLTRERVRQIIVKTTQIIKQQLIGSGVGHYFSEDYYAYLYQNYDVPKVFMLDYSDATAITLFYLQTYYNKGKIPLQEGLKDPLLSIYIKHNIQRFCRKNYIRLDQNWVFASRASVEDYVLVHYCKDAMSFDGFVDCYHQVLTQNNIQDKSLWITKDVKTSRYNRLSELPSCLVTTGKILRYYNFESYDFNAFLLELDLNQYQNIKLSTAKFMRLHPELMEAYDIRTELELHAILKHVVDESKLDGKLTFSRMPILVFGSFDMDAYLLKIIKDYGPIESRDLYELVSNELGYREETLAANECNAIKMYCHKGVYSMEIDMLDDLELQQIGSRLNQNSYRIEDAKAMFLEVFPHHEGSCFNPYNLKKLGFKVFQSMILRNYVSLEEFYRHVLLEDDVVDIATILDYFHNDNNLVSIITRLKKSYDLIEFQPRKYLNFRKLAKAGKDKRELIEYCNEVYAHIEANTYFTVYSLQQQGLTFTLDDYGFEPMFYASILAQDDRFSVLRMFNQNIFYRKPKSALTAAMFMQDLVAEHQSINLYDVMDLLATTYGCRGVEAYKLIASVKDTDIVYHPIMETFYVNEQCYHAEFDEGAL